MQELGLILPDKNPNLSIHIFAHDYRFGQELSSKPRLEQLKGNVVAQESKLEQGMKMLNVAKKKALSGSQTKAGEDSEWKALENVIGLMDDLLTSYRKYTDELERKAKKLDLKVAPSRSRK